jgi:uncharacterized protein VirK/YbjX
MSIEVFPPTARPALGPLAFFLPLLSRRFTNVERSWLIRSMAAPLVALRWSSFISNFYNRYGHNSPHTMILRKPLVEYAIGGISQSARLAILLNHYELLAARFRPRFLSDLCAGQHVQLACLSGKGDEFLIWLGASDQVWMSGEGEVVFCLQDVKSRLIMSKLAAFLAHAEGDPIMVIGGLRSSLGMKQSVVKATRKLYGLRPKDALLLAARAFASASGFSQIHAISNERHVERSGGMVYSDFDSYWLDRGARRGGRYGFILPAENSPITGASQRDSLKRQIVEDVREVASELVAYPRAPAWTSTAECQQWPNCLNGVR